MSFLYSKPTIAIAHKVCGSIFRASAVELIMDDLLRLLSFVKLLKELDSSSQVCQLFGAIAKCDGSFLLQKLFKLYLLHFL